MRFAFSHPDHPEIIEGMCRWAGPRMGCSFNPALATGISVLCAHGAATVLYTDFNKADVRMHVAGVGNWLNRTSLAVFFGYPFQELGVHRVTGLVSKKNKKARNLNEKLGFVQEGCLRKGFENGDSCIIYGMLREECRWLKEGEENGQRQRQAP